MAKQSAIQQDGTITEALSNAMFRVELENGHIIYSIFCCYFPLSLIHHNDDSINTN